jgi:hypothetical protein
MIVALSKGELTLMQRVNQKVNPRWRGKTSE